MATVSSLAEANRQYFDVKATEYDTKDWQKAVMAQLTTEMRAHRDIFGLPPDDGRNDDGRPPFRLLDYACGTGLVSRALGPYVDQTVGIDLSANMVSTYNARAHEAGLAADVARAVQGDLLTQPAYIIVSDTEVPGRIEGQAVLDQAQFGDFDAVVVGLGLHHFEGWARCLRVLAERCRPGGVVAIVDFFPKESRAVEQDLDRLPEHMRGMMHKSGFTEDEMRGYMQEAGLVEVRFIALQDKVTIKMHGQSTEKQVFLASGRRA